MEILNEYFKKSSMMIAQLEMNVEVISSMANGIYDQQLKGGKLLIAGNGGSCADAEHFAGEMTCTFKDRNRRGFSAISLSNNASAITAWVNDFNYESYFSRQVESLGTAGDILFLISTGGGDPKTGASMNLVSAAETALKKDMEVYSIVGKTGGELSRISHQYVKVASFETSQIQEGHIAIIHAICLVLDEIVKR